MPQQPINPAQVEKCLNGIDFPCDKQEIVEFASQHGANDMVRDALNNLPDKNYESTTAVNKALGESSRSQR
jgi:hypothetical protein